MGIVNNADNHMLGEKEIQRIYIGRTLIWERKASEYDETKVSVILLDASGKRTDTVLEFIDIRKALTYIRDNEGSGFDLYVGHDWKIDSDMEHEFPTSQMTQYCSGLKNVVNIDIQSISFTYLAPAMFTGCAKLKNLRLPDSVTFVGANLCSGDMALETVNIPGSIRDWGSNLFAGCSSLKNVVIPKTPNCDYIGGGTFAGCIGLERLEIPSTITRFDSNPPIFSSCISLTELVIHSPEGSIDGYPWGIPFPDKLHLVWTG